MQIKREIFKEYDIRGKYPAEINNETIYKIAVAFVKFLKLNPPAGGGNIVVGYDNRPGSKKLANSAIKGIIDSGINAMVIDETKTPIFEFAVSFLKADAGMMITASHNPFKYNGIKLSGKNSIPVGGKSLIKIYEITKRQN